MKQDIRIRIATEQDAAALLSFYAPYVTETAITFEYEAPTLEEFTRRIRTTLKKYPWIVAENEQGELVGYACASAFKSRPAYDWAVETTIYVKQSEKRSGIGARLYAVLEKLLAAQNVLNLNACIAYPAAEDEYLTLDSVRFHEKLGYQMVGTFHKCGYKFNRWYDMVWMEKMIGEHPACQPALKTFEEIRQSIQNDL